jgi:hypothetical protein
MKTIQHSTSEDTRQFFRETVTRSTTCAGCYFVCPQCGRFDNGVADDNEALKANPKMATSLYGRAESLRQGGAAPLSWFQFFSDLAFPPPIGSRNKVKHSGQAQSPPAPRNKLSVVVNLS